jgi:hypothetical protein
VEPGSVPTRQEILWRVDCFVTWGAPHCTLPEALRGPELNIIAGKGAYKFDQPRHLLRVGFEINAPDEESAQKLARQQLRHHFRTMEERHADHGDELPTDLDLHVDRIVLDRLAVRRIVGSPLAVPQVEDGGPAQPSASTP